MALHLLAPGEGVNLAHRWSELTSPIPIGATVILRAGTLEQIAAHRSDRDPRQCVGCRLQPQRRSDRVDSSFQARAPGSLRPRLKAPIGRLWKSPASRRRATKHPSSDPCTASHNPGTGPRRAGRDRLGRVRSGRAGSSVATEAAAHAGLVHSDAARGRRRVPGARPRT